MGIPGVNSCGNCLEKQRKIDALEDEVQRLKRKLREHDRKALEAPFGSSTPSAKKPLKPNTQPALEKKKRGALNGHKGTGRKGLGREDAQRVVEVPGPCTCPDCGAATGSKAVDDRSVIDLEPMRVEVVMYVLQKTQCPKCGTMSYAKAPGVLPRGLFSNRLLATVSRMHYLDGMPLLRVCEQLGLNPGAVIGALHRVARLLEPTTERLVEDYRNAPVKHADETVWRTEGQNGYAWLFATPDLSIFRFRHTRSGEVPRSVLGTGQLPGVLVVDRYIGYRKLKIQTQYCYAHLLREVEDLEKEFGEVAEVVRFCSTVKPLLAAAMGLRGQDIPDEEFYKKAKEVKAQIETAMDSDAQHLGVRGIQEIFRKNRDRLYHWAQDRRVPADNNLAERDLRPTVIARKISFGSQSKTGARTRETLMSLPVTLKKRKLDPFIRLTAALDRLAEAPQADLYPILLGTTSSSAPAPP